MAESNITTSHIVLAELPHHDGTSKMRPCLLLTQMKPFGDYLSCGISTKLRHFVPNFDDVILPDDPDFKVSGLQFPSLIRLGWLAMVPEASIEGSIGQISIERHKRLVKNLITYLIENS